jgi:hypothetical protein
MVQRCTNPNHVWYSIYQGMFYTPWWDFQIFLQDMGLRPTHTTLDRIDTTKGYSPDNCRWADVKTQQRNKTSTKLSEIQANKIRLQRAEGLLIRELSCLYEVSQSTIKNVLYRGDWQ